MVLPLDENDFFSISYPQNQTFLKFTDACKLLILFNSYVYERFQNWGKKDGFTPRRKVVSKSRNILFYSVSENQKIWLLMNKNGRKYGKPLK